MRPGVLRFGPGDRLLGGESFGMRTLRFLLAFLVLPAVALPAGLSSARATCDGWRVGAGAESIAPTAAQLKEGLYLGGYGLSSGQVGLGPAKVKAMDGRLATGVMKDPLGAVAVRALAVSDGCGRNTIVLADLDNQGMFAAYKPNLADPTSARPGIDDIRAAVAKATGVPASNLVISSDHSHAGQDLIGAWGFVPDGYLRFVRDQAVKAFTRAIASMQRARITEGASQTPGACDPRRILSNQFDCTDPVLGRVDDEMRVLQARARNGRVIATVVNFAAHATVMDSDNTLVSPDWPGVAARYLEQKYGGVGIVLVADVGRSQPNRSDCTKAELAAALARSVGAYDIDPRLAAESCSLSKYSRMVMSYAVPAIARATPLTGSGVQATSYFIHDPSDSVALFGLDYAGDPVGAPIARKFTPPYLAGTVLGTWVSVFRMGTVLISTNPGEAYPNIREQLMAQVRGPRRFWTIGLANDQLGYLIAPLPEGYPKPIFSSFFDGDINNPATWSPDPIGNDNYFFNISPTIGDHVMCAQVRGVSEMRVAGWSVNVASKCTLWVNEPNTATAGFPPPL